MSTLVTIVFDDTTTPHILAAPGSRNAALCGYAPYNPWRGFWTRELDEVREVCAKCRLALASTRPAKAIIA